MAGSLDQFVSNQGQRKPAEYGRTMITMCVIRAHKVVGRIMLHPQAPKDLPWFWTITARECYQLEMGEHMPQLDERVNWLELEMGDRLVQLERRM
jgi:hypothetical protein